MKRILYFSRESDFISESKDPLLNNNKVNDAQLITKKAVESEGIVSSDNKVEAVVVDANGFLLLPETKYPLQDNQESLNYLAAEKKQNSEQKSSKKLAVKKAVLYTKKKSETAVTKPNVLVKQQTNKAIENSQVDIHEDITRENTPEEISVLGDKHSDTAANVIYDAQIDTDVKVDLTGVVLEKNDATDVDQLPLKETLKNEAPFIQEEQPTEAQPVQQQEKSALISSIESSEVDLQDPVVDHAVKENNFKNVYDITATSKSDIVVNDAAKNEKLPENIMIHVDAQAGNYSTPEHLAIAYETIELSHIESVENKTDQIVTKKNKSIHTENLIINEVIRGAKDVSTLDSKRSYVPSKSTLTLKQIENDGHDDVFDASKFFQEDSQSLVNEEVVEFSEGASEVPSKSESKTVGLSREKDALPVESEKVPTENEKIILSELDHSKLDDQGIIFFAGVNSDLVGKSQQDPLGEILSFERKVLKNLGAKGGVEQHQSNVVKPKKDQLVSDKIKSLKLFDNVVKKLTSNNQQEADMSLVQSKADHIQNEISFDGIRDTYQKIFSAYK